MSESTTEIQVAELPLNEATIPQAESPQEELSDPQKSFRAMFYEGLWEGTPDGRLTLLIAELADWHNRIEAAIKKRIAAGEPVVSFEYSNREFVEWSDADQRWDLIKPVQGEKHSAEFPVLVCFMRSGPPLSRRQIG